MTEQRRLAAILVADVVGYSRLIGSDEAGTLALLQALRTEILEPQIAKHAGRLFKSVGDGFLVEFASAVQAVSCAGAIQAANGKGRLPLRIGIHVGDVVVQGDDLMGDGVNVAARVEGIAEPGGIAITRAVHEQVRDKLDLRFVDKGEIELKNIQRPVQVFVIGGMKIHGQGTALPLPDKPSIAVLPFQNMGGDPEQEYFVDGLVEDIITALSRFKSLFVIARNSSFTYKGKAIDIRQVGHELGVQYVLEGSVRKAGSRVRITGQLIRAETGAHVWADRFEGATADVFDLQDEVVEKVIAAIAPSVERAEIEAAQRKPTANLSAHDCYLRASPFWWSGNRDKSDEALRLLKRALEIDPGHSSAMGLLLAVYGNRRGVGLVNDLEKENSEARLLLPRVMQIGREDAVALGYAAWAIAFILRDLTFAQEQVKRALTLNANLASAWGFSAWINLWSGNPTQAVEDLSHANRLDPLNESANWTTAWAHAYFYLDRHEDAVRAAESMFQRNPLAHAALRIGSAAAALGVKWTSPRSSRPA
jgi:TolB-like protein